MEDLPETTTPLDYIPIDQFLQENKNENEHKNTKDIEQLIQKLKLLEEKNRSLENQVIELKLNSKELIDVLKKIRDTLDHYFLEENIEQYSE